MCSLCSVWKGGLQTVCWIKLTWAQHLIKEATESKPPAEEIRLSCNWAWCLYKKKIPQSTTLVVFYLLALSQKKIKNEGNVVNELSRLSSHCCTGNKGVLAEISVSHKQQIWKKNSYLKTSSAWWEAAALMCQKHRDKKDRVCVLCDSLLGWSIVFIGGSRLCLFFSSQRSNVLVSEKLFLSHISGFTHSKRCTETQLWPHKQQSGSTLSSMVHKKDSEEIKTSLSVGRFCFLINVVAKVWIVLQSMYP